MKSTILISTFGLLLGCNQSDRTARHEQKAAEERQEAQKDLMKGREEANKDLAKGREEANKDLANAREKANKDLDKAHEQSIKANESDKDRDYSREPVAGREDTMLVRDSLKDKLGDDWMIEKGAAGWTAIRKQMKKADKDMTKKVNDEIKSARDDHKNLNVSYTRGEVVMRGSVDDCDDVGKTANSFAKIDGINKIVAEMTCNKK
jgi:hypothetical protein